MYFDSFISFFIAYITQDNFAQVFGFLWMITILTAYFQKDDFTVKKLMLLSSLFWGTHFYLLWVYAWLAAVVIFMFRLVLSLKFQKNKRAFFSVIGITIITWYFTFDGILSLLPVITSLLWAYSFFFLEKIQLRLAMMLNSSIWLVYHISIWSASWVINETFTQAILIATVYRMMHPQWWASYYAQKVRDILWRTSRPDYDRFIFLHDKLSSMRHTIGTRFLQIIHYDLSDLFKKKRTIIQRVTDLQEDVTLKKLYIK